jgi:chromosome partitioning protein
MSTTILACANQKGGVGKTTTAVNLAACLAERSKRILLVDFDAQANATSGVGLEKKDGRSLYPVLLGEARIEDLIVPTAMKKLDAIPAEVNLAGAEVDVARMDRYLHRLADVLRPLAAQERYDFIFLDCPPSLGILTMNALTAADRILMPIQCEYYALEGLSVMVRVAEQLRQSGANPGLEIDGIVMTMYDGRTNLAQQVVQQVMQHFGGRVYETMIPRSVRLSEAPSHGQPVILYDRHCTGAAAYRQLAREFLRRHRPAEREEEATAGRPAGAEPDAPAAAPEGSPQAAREAPTQPAES